MRPVPEINREQEIRAVLADVYTPAGVETWLRSRNRMFGGARPLDLINDGRWQLVYEVAYALSEM